MSQNFKSNLPYCTMFDNAMAASTQDSKYAVADILTTMAASHHLASAQSYLPVSSASVLTPTTLHNLEQHFDLDAVPSTAPTSGAYALPQTSTGVYYDGIEPPMKTVRTSRGLAIVSAPSVIPASYSPNRRLPVRGQRGDALSADEEEKRKIRRERNKVAAAKCRQRRVDITNTLQTETDVLEDEKSKLEDEIKDLQREKEQLEFVMQAHRPMCRMEKVPQADRPMDLKVKAKPSASGIILPLKKSPSRPNCLALGRSNDSDLNTPVMNEGKLALILPPKKSPIRAYKAFLSSDSQVDDLNTPVAGDTPVISRPGSLALKRPIKKEPSDLDTPNNPTGVLISTPSSGLPSLGLDGSTGLTPVMQEFTPPVAHGTTCASEVQRTSSSDSSEVTSPTLVSL